MGGRDRNSLRHCTAEAPHLLFFRRSLGAFIQATNASPGKEISLQFLFFDFDEMASARLKASIRASVEAGEETQKYATNAGRYLRVGGRKVQLLRADGTATPAGAFYYEDLLNIERPKLYD